MLLGAALLVAGLSGRMGRGVALHFLYMGIGIATLVITLVRYVPILGW